MNHKEKNISDFRVAGINYKKTESSVRGQFAIGPEQYKSILEHAATKNISNFFIVSTCNRTEIYGLTDNIAVLMQLLCTETEGSYETFAAMSYTKNGWAAIEHLFCVGAGIDSQILGDYEILGQIKNAVKFAKEHETICPFLERLVNSVIQSSKAVKTHTELSGGTVSVSFAAVQYIKEHINNTEDKNILLFGTGKIGRNTCKNLVDYLDVKNITLVNRTKEKAEQLAATLGVQHMPIEQLSAEIAKADIIFVATNAQEPTILKSHLEGKGKKLIIDLSVPCNVEPAAQQLPGISFVDVDTLSKIKDETLQMRQAELPKAMAIIQGHIAEFNDWYEMRKHVPMLKEVKGKLLEIHTSHNTGADIDSEEKIHKVISTLATKVRRHNTAGCCYIEAINEFIA